MTQFRFRNELVPERLCLNHTAESVVHGVVVGSGQTDIDVVVAYWLNQDADELAFGELPGGVPIVDNREEGTAVSPWSI